MTIQCSEQINAVQTGITSQHRIADRINIQSMVHLAAKTIAPVWPLRTFIACNPLQGFESQPFDTALAEAQQLFSAPKSEYEAINRETIKWCGAYFDQGQSVIRMPERDRRFYHIFKDLSPYDKNLHQGLKHNKQWLNQLPDEPEDSIIQCLEILQVTDQYQNLFIKKSLAQLTGWTGYIKWQTEWQSTAQPNLLIDFVAIRLIITVLLQPEIHFSPSISRKESLSAYPALNTIKKLEADYQSYLIPLLLAEANKITILPKNTPDVQLVFCIDVRSEPFRRHLESLGSYETFGFAGFFGLPLRLYDFNSGKITNSCPVLLKPRYDIHETPTDSNQCTKKNHEQGKAFISQLKNLYKQLKYNFATPFALVETLGAWCGLLMLFKTLKPMLTFAVLSELTEWIRPTLATKPLINMTSRDNQSGISDSDQALYAEAVLRIMGLTEHFGKFVIFCGHGSRTQNNPYASGLDCGACGGNHGGGNAKTLAAILNRNTIREKLSARGIDIPKDTYFLAAEHNTTTDELHVFEDDTRPAVYEHILLRLNDDLHKAQMNNATDRVKHFNLANTVKAIEEVNRRSQDWSEVRPEWGLARNAAFIIAPRTLTQAMDLEGRCFLHSYDWAKDEDLTALETILTAPMVVAEWINTQYLFSTLDNVSYGSGSKITHNVTGKIGVMQGNSSDLMHGLPLQSVNSSDSLNTHQPQRLLTVIYAPRDKVSMIIARQEILQTLFFNAWVHVIVIEPSENKAYQLQTSGEWYLYNN